MTPKKFVLGAIPIVTAMLGAPAMAQSALSDRCAIRWHNIKRGLQV